MATQNSFALLKNYTLTTIAFAVFSFHVANTQVANNVEKNPIVQTEPGKVQGKSTKGISVFKSNSYAAPPVGDLRFAAPVKPKHWDGVCSAVKFGATPPSPFQVKQKV